MIMRTLKVLGVITLCITMSSCSMSSIRRPVQEIEMHPDNEYFARFINGQKNGYSIRRRTVETDRVTITKKSTSILKYASTPITSNESLTTIETIDGKPLSFEKTSNYETVLLWLFPIKHSEKILGVANDNGDFEITKTTNGEIEKSTISWPQGAVLGEGFSLLLKENGLQKGTSFKYRDFYFDTLSATDNEINVGETTNIELCGRQEPLTEVFVTHRTESGTLSGKTYIDKNFQEQKTVQKIPNLKVEEIACSREFALSKNEAFDMSTLGLVHCPAKLKNYKNAKSISYQLVSTGTESLQIPATDYQNVRPGPNGSLIITVRPIKPPAGISYPYQGDNQIALKAMKPTKLLQSDNEAIIALARKAIGKTKDAATAATRIESFVFGYLKKEKTLKPGFTPSIEIAKDRKGDCKEHAVLTAAMCRAVGIPAQIVTGCVYSRSRAGLKHVFVPHAWTQVYIGEKWIGLDSTRYTLWGLVNRFTAGHIATAIENGDDAMLSSVAAMGKFKIKAVKQ